MGAAMILCKSHTMLCICAASCEITSIGHMNEMVLTPSCIALPNQKGEVLYRDWGEGRPSITESKREEISDLCG